MPESLEQILISVWRQVLLEDSKTVKVDGRSFPVQRTSRSKLCEVDFEFEGQRLRGLEQNPKTNSRWAQLAREGKKVMQFLSGSCEAVKFSCDGRSTFAVHRVQD